MADEIHLPPFQYGKHTVQASGYRSVAPDQKAEMSWTIRVDDTWLGSLTTSTDVTREVLIKRIEDWISQNLAKQTE